MSIDYIERHCKNNEHEVKKYSYFFGVFEVCKHCYKSLASYSKSEKFDEFSSITYEQTLASHEEALLKKDLVEV